MLEWWNTLTPLLQGFYALAIISSAVLVIQTILLIAGIGVHDLALGDFDHGGAAEHGSGLSILSIRTIIAFLTGFGWTGVLVIKAGGPAYLALLLAMIAGIVLAASVLWMMRAMRRLAHDGTRDFANAVGQVATVYVTIPPNGVVGGQVEVTIQGRMCTVAAISRSTTPIAPGTKVRISELADRITFIVTSV